MSEKPMHIPDSVKVTTQEEKISDISSRILSLDIPSGTVIEQSIPFSMIDQVELHIIAKLSEELKERAILSNIGEYKYDQITSRESLSHILRGKWRVAPLSVSVIKSAFTLQESDELSVIDPENSIAFQIMRSDRGSHKATEIQCQYYTRYKKQGRHEVRPYILRKVEGDVRKFQTSYESINKIGSSVIRSSPKRRFS